MYWTERNDFYLPANPLTGKVHHLQHIRKLNIVISATVSTAFKKYIFKDHGENMCFFHINLGIWQVVVEAAGGSNSHSKI